MGRAYVMRTVAMIGFLTASAAAADPFADVSAPREPGPAVPAASWTFFSENFGFRKELMSQFSYSRDASRVGSRQSIGFEVLKKFSSETSTWASVDFQGRLVRRDHYVPALNDAEGMSRPGWFLEYHNAYADLYNVFDPLLDDEGRGAVLGHFNLRVGRFYVPFGLNLQTDTHGTVLQLSNERNVGFERDWYAGLWGTLSPDLDYGVYYLAGSGYDLKLRGQSGLAAVRVSLSGRYAADYGLEGGVSVLGGERLSPAALDRSPAVMANAAGSDRVRTLRVGADARWRLAAPTGTLTWTTELSGGYDAPDSVFTQLHQLEYLQASRRWGLAAQFHRFWQDPRRSRTIAPGAAPGPADSSISGEATWYFRNDVAGSNLQWIKLNVERQTERQQGTPDVIVTLQYYQYW